MDSPRPYDVLAIGAHPDDVEVGAGGVIIKLTDAGHRVALAILTRGEMGTGGTAEIREAEVRRATDLLGADLIAHLDWGDTRLADTAERRQEIAALIRQTRPRIVLCPYPHVAMGRRQSHPDHVAAGLLAINGGMLAGLKKADVPGELHRVGRYFFYFLPPKVKPDFVVDITAQFDRWIAALSAHESQFRNPQKSKNYIEQLTAMARMFGLAAGCMYGQGFAAPEPLLVPDITALSENPEYPNTPLIS